MDLVQAIRSHARFPALLKEGALDLPVLKELARDVGTTAGVVRDVALGDAAAVAEAIRKHGEKQRQLAQRATSDFGAVAQGGGLGAGMGARALALAPRQGVLAGLRELVDGVRGVQPALADGKIELHEVWELIELQRDLGGITKKERAALHTLLGEHGDKFAPLARQTLERFLALADPNAPAKTPPTPLALRTLWDSDRASFPLTTALVAAPPADAAHQAARLFSTTTSAAQKTAVDVALFYRQYPSNGGAQIVAFHSQWATWDTLAKNPLQAFLYETTKPFNDAGQPRGPRWQAYVTAIETGAPAAVVEEAFLRAHIHDFQTVLAEPKFEQLYALSQPHYRKVIDAYVDTLQTLEKKLDDGVDPTKVARSLMPQTFRCLLKRGTIGMMWTPQVFSQTFNFANPTTRNMWRGFWDIAKNVLFHIGVKAPPATKLAFTLTAEQAKDLKARTGIDFKAGEQTLDKGAFKKAHFAEAERREHPVGPPKSYPLRFEDFLEQRKMRGASMAGRDGTFSAADVEGVLRQVEGRRRSQLIAEFHAAYPVPQGGILQYSANMLAMNGAYVESAMFGDLPNRITPVDNDGKPKNALWQAFVDASVSHQKTGAPSQERLELLWLKAHMKDFEAVDTPVFRAKLDEFWMEAALDPVMAPMAIYTKAMLLGRTEFEKSTKQGVPEEVAFAHSLKHFVTTMLEFRTFPFWQSDLRELGRLLFDKETRQQPDADDRGLASDKALIERSISGIKDMFALARIVAAGARMEQVGGVAGVDRRSVDQMVDLSLVLPKEKLAQLDPRIVAFYANPMNFDVTTGVEMPWLNRIVMGGIGSFVAQQGQIPDRQRGFEGYPLEMELYQDPQGAVHWDRHVVVDGKRRTLFNAQFEVTDVDGKKMLRETFRVAGQQVALFFNADVKDGKLVLSLDEDRSSKMARTSDITFTTSPSKEGLVTTGAYVGTGIDCTGAVTFKMRPKTPS